MKFHHCWPIPGKMRLATTRQDLLFFTPEKNLSDVHAPLCRSGFLKLSCTYPTIHKRIYAGVIIQLYK